MMPGADPNPSRAGFDWRAFARTVRAAHAADGRGVRAIATEIGVTASDLSRAMSGINIDAGKVMALCDWAGVSERAFYLPPEKDVVKSGCCTAAHVKQPKRAHVTAQPSRKSSDQTKTGRAPVTRGVS